MSFAVTHETHPPHRAYMADLQDERTILALYLEGDAGSARQLGAWVEEVVRIGSWKFPDAEGVVQDVMIRLLVAARDRRYRGESSLRTFVHSIAKHACIDAHRRVLLAEKAERLASEEGSWHGDLGDPESARRRSERIERLRHIVDTLSDECRQLWRWVYRDGLTSRDVAGKLGIREGAARVRVHRCLESARRMARVLEEGPA